MRGQIGNRRLTIGAGVDGPVGRARRDDGWSHINHRDRCLAGRLIGRRIADGNGDHCIAKAHDRSGHRRLRNRHAAAVIAGDNLCCQIRNRRLTVGAGVDGLVGRARGDDGRIRVG